MILLVVLVVVIVASPSSLAMFGKLRPSFACPLVFFVETEIAARDVEDALVRRPDYGTCIYSDGSFRRDFFIRESRLRGLYDDFPCATTVAVSTDDEQVRSGEVERWIAFECARLKYSPNDCYVVGNGDYGKFSASRNAFALRKIVEERKISTSSEHTTGRPTSEPPTFAPSTSSPTRRPTTAPTEATSSPTLSSSCRDRKRKNDCVSDGRCRWFGPFLGCDLPDFCGFETRLSCESRTWCAWRNAACHKK